MCVYEIFSTRFVFMILVETFLSRGREPKPIQGNSTHNKYKKYDKYFISLEYYMPLLYKSSLFHTSTPTHGGNALIFYSLLFSTTKERRTCSHRYNEIV
jgi:hypothetical protein